MGQVIEKHESFISEELGIVCIDRARQIKARLVELVEKDRNLYNKKTFLGRFLGRLMIRDKLPKMAMEVEFHPGVEVGGRDLIAGIKVNQQEIDRDEDSSTMESWVVQIRGTTPDAWSGEREPHVSAGVNFSKSKVEVVRTTADQSSGAASPTLKYTINPGERTVWCAEAFGRNLNEFLSGRSPEIDSAEDLADVIAEWGQPSEDELAHLAVLLEDGLAALR